MARGRSSLPSRSMAATVALTRAHAHEHARRRLEQIASGLDYLHNVAGGAPTVVCVPARPRALRCAALRTVRTLLYHYYNNTLMIVLLL